MAEHRLDWDAKVAFMRDRGVISAAWDEQDRLESVSLGPLPLVPIEHRDRKPVTALARSEQTRSTILAAGSRLVSVPRDPNRPR